MSDKKAAIEQLADRYDYIDIDRVGIYGHSGGGFMSTAAMLVYPDFFKVAVSSSGNHDNDVYNANWSEKHDGIEEVVDDEGEVTFEYDIDRNSDLAANLKGHLLLTTSDEDNNVHPAGTLRMADAAHQGEQALRLLRLFGPATRLWEHERLLVLAAGRVLRGSPPGEWPVECRHLRATGGEPQDGLTPDRQAVTCTDNDLLRGLDTRWEKR